MWKAVHEKEKQEKGEKEMDWKKTNIIYHSGFGKSISIPATSFYCSHFCNVLSLRFFFARLYVSLTEENKNYISL